MKNGVLKSIAANRKKLSAQISEIRKRHDKRRNAWAVWPAPDASSITDLAKVLLSYDVELVPSKTFDDAEELWKVAADSDRRRYRKIARRVLVLLNKRPIP